MTDATKTFRLDDKVAVITGGSRGIGAAMAQLFADAGATVVVTGRKEPALVEVVDGIKAKGGKADHIVAHAGKSEDAATVVDTVIERHGRLDVLVCNAAANPVFGALLDVPEAAFDKIYEVNVKGPMLLAQKAHPHLAKQGGSIVLISSIGGVSPEPGLGVYSTSKAALLSLTQVMAKEWGADGIRVNAICPGLVKTKFSQALWQNEDILEVAVGTQPLARMAEPEEIAPLALFLASDASSYSTGGTFMADGGHTI